MEIDKAAESLAHMTQLPSPQVAVAQVDSTEELGSSEHYSHTVNTLESQRDAEDVKVCDVAEDALNEKSGEQKDVAELIPSEDDRSEADSGGNHGNEPDVVEEDEEEESQEQEEEEECEEEEEEDDFDGGEVEEEEVEEEMEDGMPKKPKSHHETFTIGSKKYSRSAFLQNVGLEMAEKKLRGNPKAELQCCTNCKPHNMLQCKSLHLLGRAILISDHMYVRLNMIVESKGRQELFSNPSKALQKKVCLMTDEGHCVAECSGIHLRPQIVFIGTDKLKTAYYEEELVENMGLKKLKEEKLEEQCGSWCKTSRSHVVATCRYIHYLRGQKHYTEKAKAPSIPLAAIPDMTPKNPREGFVGRGRGGRGRERGRGGRQRGSGGRGRGRGGNSRNRAGAVNVPVPASLRQQLPAGRQKATSGSPTKTTATTPSPPPATGGAKVSKSTVSSSKGTGAGSTGSPTQGSRPERKVQAATASSEDVSHKSILRMLFIFLFLLVVLMALLVRRFFS